MQTPLMRSRPGRRATPSHPAMGVHTQIDLGTGALSGSWADGEDRRVAHDDAGTRSPTGAGRPTVDRARLLTVLPGLAGCALVAVAASPRYTGGLAPLIVAQRPGDTVTSYWFAQ